MEVDSSQEEEGLEQNSTIFAELLCRIFMYEEDNRKVLATLKLTTLLAEMFHTQQLPETDTTSGKYHHSNHETGDGK